MPGELARSSAIALSAAIELKNCLREKPLVPQVLPGKFSLRLGLVDTPAVDNTVVFLCRCGDGISSILDFPRIMDEINEMNGVLSVQTLPQSCTLEGAEIIREYVEQHNIKHVVLAACRCCNLEQICFSCTDRRVMCQHNLSVELPENVNIEFVNIREQCAWIHRDDPEGATNKALELISTGVVRAQRVTPAEYTSREVLNSVIIFSTGLPGLAAASSLAVQGYPLSVVFDLEVLRSNSTAHLDTINRLLMDLNRQDITILGWPDKLKLNGIPGKYQAVLQDGSGTKSIEAGSVILDIADARKEILDLLADSNLISRVLARQHHFSRVSSLDSTIIHSFTVRETAGIFNVIPVGDPEKEDLVKLGEAAAARASIYLRQESLMPRSSSVVIREKLCRGCGDCVKLCPYIELKTSAAGNCYAWVDPALCFGCGACISVCPTGAITQPLQSEVGIIAALEALVKNVNNVSEVR